MISIDEIRSSLPNVYKFAIKTPLVRCYALSNEYVDVYLKLENIQPIGSFKIRGAANAMQHIPIAELSNGVFTASAGNMAQGLAFCAKSVGVQCTVICPDTAPQTKIDAVERLNAKVVKVPFDDWWNTFKTRSFPGVNARFVHAFDDDHVMAGNGTIGLEIVEQLPDVDCVLVPVGGGGLVCGIASALRQLKPDCKVYACEVATSAPFDAAFRNGVPTKIAHQNTFVDGIGSAVCFDSMFQRAKALVDGVLVASLDDTAAAVRLLVERNRVVAEGAGAVGVGCVIGGKAETMRARKIVCVVSGGNINSSKLAEILSTK